MPSPLPGRVFPPASVDERIERLCGELMLAATAAIQEGGVFHLALPADVPPALDAWYTAMVIDPRWRGIPWGKTHLWQSAEGARRSVSQDPSTPSDVSGVIGHGGSWQALTEALLAHLPLEPSQLHPLQGSPVGSAGAAGVLDGFAEDLERVFADAPARMDMAITTESTLAMPVVAIDSWQLAAAKHVVLWLDREPPEDLVKAARYFEGEVFWVRADQTREGPPPMIDLV